jgi:choline dehydrogenase
LLLDGKRIIGAETDRGTVRCRRETVLCAGSINTPQLLMLSGIGPAPHLREHGIDVAADIPGVGQNLIDHVAADLAFALKQPSPP